MDKVSCSKKYNLMWKELGQNEAIVCAKKIINLKSTAAGLSSVNHPVKSFIWHFIISCSQSVIERLGWLNCNQVRLNCPSRVNDQSCELMMQFSFYNVLILMCISIAAQQAVLKMLQGPIEGGKYQCLGTASVLGQQQLLKSTDPDWWFWPWLKMVF